MKDYKKMILIGNIALFVGIIGCGFLTQSKEVESSKEETVVEETTEDFFPNFKEVTIFDTEEYLFVATDFYLDETNRCCIDFYFENRSDDTDYQFQAKECSINGIQCKIFWEEKIGKNHSETYTLCLADDKVDISEVSGYYSVHEYMNIGILFAIQPTRSDQGKEEKMIYLYPQGEEMSEYTPMPIS